MPLVNNMNLAGGAYQVSPEQRALKNERKRVESYIRLYQQNPEGWNNSMIQQLEGLALRYQVPFKRAIPPATALEKIGAGLVGAADSIAFDLIPDDIYSSEKTRSAANVGKMAGAIGQIGAGIAAAGFTGGASLLAAAKGTGALAKAAKALVATNKGLAAVGGVLPGSKLTTSAIQQGRKALQPYGAGQGWKWATKMGKDASKAASTKVLKDAKTVINQGGDLGPLLKGVSLSKANKTTLLNEINKVHKNTNMGKALTRQVNQATELGSDIISNANIVSLVNNAPRGNLAAKNFTERTLFNAGGKNRGNIPNWTPQKSKALYNEMKEAGVKTWDDAVMYLSRKGVTPAGPPPPVALADIDKYGALGALGTGAFAASPLASRIPSRESLEGAQDPFDPYNQ
jgi:hypothetical protein